MDPHLRLLLERTKLHCLTEGVSVDPAVLDLLSDGGRRPLTVHEYATTGGLTLDLGHDVLVNAPFDQPYCEAASVRLVASSAAPSGVAVTLDGEVLPVRRVLPLPGFLASTDAMGRPLTDVAMSHADRLRLPPIVGCAYDCAFCDLPSVRYRRRPAEQLVAALAAVDDDALPARHVLISGGSPGPAHHAYFEEVCSEVVRQAGDLPVDIMMSPWPGDPDFVRRMHGRGVAGWSINTEIYDERTAELHIRAKHRHARPGLEEFIATAVEVTGGAGAVRSLLVAGLEPIDRTIDAMEWLASLGCDPVISPFRPAPDTVLHDRPPASPDDMAHLLEAGRDIAARHGVALGPRCTPCQHNTLSFPWDVSLATTD